MRPIIGVLDEKSGEVTAMPRAQELTASTSNLREEPAYHFAGRYDTPVELKFNIDFERILRNKKRLGIYYRTLLGKRAKFLLRGIQQGAGK